MGWTQRNLLLRFLNTIFTDAESLISGDYLEEGTSESRFFSMQYGRMQFGITGAKLAADAVFQRGGKSGILPALSAGLLVSSGRFSAAEKDLR